MRNWGQRGQLWVAGIGAALLAALPVKAADTIYLDYGYLSRSLPVSALEAFAKTGEVSPELKSYFDMLNATPQAQESFRQTLDDPVDINVAQLGQLLYTAMGERLLYQFGNYIQTEARQNGQFAIRAAILKAAAEPSGLTLLEVLQQYPTEMRVDVEATLQLAKSLGIVIDATNFFTQAIAHLSTVEAQTEAPTDFSALANLTQPGSFGVEQARWQLRDESRNRNFYVDIYQPKQWQLSKTRVIVMSHGLGSRPEDFAQWARHLASYGYLVAVPQHPGSDAIYAQETLQGLHPNLFALSEFIDRPRDVSYLLDELERHNQSEFAGRLDLQSVGVLGHSFGGYTAIALAGASIDFESLQTACDNNLDYLDISLFLQCRALELPRQTYNFRDPRVTAVFALNPVNTSIFGARGLGQIQIPILLGAGTHDPATPAVFEQVRSFTLLKTPDKYLALLEGQAHVDFSNLDAGVSQLVSSLTSLTLPPPQLLNAYSNALSVAFFGTELLRDEAYKPYLQADYTEYLSREQTFKVFLISAISNAGILQTSEEFRSRL